MSEWKREERTLGERLQHDEELTKNSDDWDFVAKFYPNYYGSDEIMRNGDLAKLNDNDSIEEGDGSHRMLMEDYGGDIKNPQIKIDFLESELEIYKTAIQAYLQTLDKKNEKV